jgi:hypothetical protein
MQYATSLCRNKDYKRDLRFRETFGILQVAACPWFYLTRHGPKSKQEAVETARSVLRWMQESEKCSVTDDLHRMVEEHTEKHKPLAYILGMNALV